MMKPESLRPSFVFSRKSPDSSGSDPQLPGSDPQLPRMPCPVHTALFDEAHEHKPAYTGTMSCSIVARFEQGVGNNSKRWFMNVMQT